jgi:ribosomal protein S12 methylthiotransferase accessory factor YcaO
MTAQEREAALMTEAISVSSILGGSLFLAWGSLTRRGKCADGGACDIDPERARLRAFGEAAERVCLLAPDVTAEEFASGHSKDLKVPLSAFVPTSIVTHHWVRGRSAAGERLIPADIALLGWDPPAPYKRLCVQTSVGTAAASDRLKAERSAQAEVIERHYIRRTWRRASRLAAASDQLAATLPGEVEAQLAVHRLITEAWIVADSPLPVALVALHRKGGRAITFGAAAREDARIALVHAFTEAVAIRAALAGKSTGGPLEETRWRAARASTTKGHLYLALLRSIEDRRPAPERGDIDSAVTEAFGVEPVFIDLGNQDGLTVVRAVCPGSSITSLRGKSDDELLPYLA